MSAYLERCSPHGYTFEFTSVDDDDPIGGPHITYYPYTYSWIFDTDPYWKWIDFKLTKAAGVFGDDIRVSVDLECTSAETSTLIGKVMRATYHPMSNDTSSVFWTAGERKWISGTLKDVPWIDGGVRIACGWSISGGFKLWGIKVDGILQWSNDEGYVKLSADGGYSFGDITPTIDSTRKAAIAFAGLEVATIDSALTYALCRNALVDPDEEYHLMVYNGSSWTEQVDFNDIDPADADGQSSLGAWPSDSERMFCLQYRSPGGTPTDMIVYSIDQGETFADKSGDWSSAIGSTWGITKAWTGSITPVWLN